MGNTLAWVVSIIVLAYAGIAALLYISQRSLLYMPTPENTAFDEESIRLQSGGETIKIWRIGSGTNALVYFGGNAEDVAWNIPEFRQYFPGHTVYLVNYRGYGGSTGKTTESGLVEDALNIYDMVRRNHEKISIMGRSLGSLVAVQLAAERKLHRLVLITPFDSVLNMAKDIYPIFPVSFLLKDKFDAAARLNEIRAPVLILVAEKDGIIPRERTNAVIDAMPANQVTVRIIEHATHNDIQNSASYTDALISFIEG